MRVRIHEVGHWVFRKMSRFSVAGALFTGALCFFGTARAARAQHEHGAMSGPVIAVGAQAVGLARHASPAMQGADLTEVYLTQPALMMHAMTGDAHFSFDGMVNFEGLTLERGELDHGVWGEGYIDRRHPHTYLHEAVLTAQASTSGFTTSASIGRGFAPFGTDDPMVRPFVSYPSNHHLSQVLERWIAIAAVRRGPIALELGKFNGDEPTGPKSLGRIRRFGDSWSTRATVLPLPGVEVQASYAHVTSPEKPAGGGLDQRKRSASARIEIPLRAAKLYALVEGARTADVHGDLEAFVFTSLLAEASAERAGWRVALRYENSERPEEERRSNLFRSVRPSTDNSILGESRWHTWSASAGRDIRAAGVTFAPFIEASRSTVRSVEASAVFDPVALFGSDRIWGLAAGLRIAAGMKHTRMGRYGAASN